MKTVLRAVVAAFFALLLQPALAAGERGTMDEAVALVKKAVAYLNANGQEKAAAAFNTPKGEFADRDLYVWAADLKTGVAWAHGVNSKFIGQDLYKMTDNTGKRFISELFAKVKEKGSGSVDYQWLNPVTKAIEHKTTYAEKVGNNVVACGIYKAQ